MRIDVSDLFDDFFAMATIAYTRFRFVSLENDSEKLDDWDAFCTNLSDSYFLALVANRAHELTHERIPIPEIKRRIIIRHEMGVDGARGFNLSYEFPLFHHSSERPCAFAGLLTNGGDSQVYSSLFRPKHSLMLYLGTVPEPEIKLDRLPYNQESESKRRYFCEHGYVTMFSGTLTKFYELHDGWTLREITLGDQLSRHKLPTPWWKPIENLVEIDVELFESLWGLAENEVAD